MNARDKLTLYFLLVLFAVMLWFVLPHEPAQPPTASQLALRPEGATQIDFRALGHNSWDSLPPVTYAQATARMGEGSLVKASPDGRTRTYQWNGGGRWARLEATFRDDSVVGRMQFLLRKH
jgi:hypothetical protein